MVEETAKSKFAMTVTNSAAMTPDEELRQVLAAMTAHYDIRLSEGMGADSEEAKRMRHEYSLTCAALERMEAKDE